MDIDPLRAGHVAIFDGHTKFFCGLDCRRVFLDRHPELVRIPTNQGRSTSSTGSSTPAPKLPPLQSDDAADARSIEHTPREPSATAPEQNQSDTATLLILSAISAAVLGTAIALVGSWPWVLYARLTLVGLASILLTVRMVHQPFRHEAAPPRWPVLAPVWGTAAVALWALVNNDPIITQATLIAGLLVITLGLTQLLIDISRRSGVVETERIRTGLHLLGRKITKDGFTIIGADRLRPGEEIVVSAGETVPADADITAGDAKVYPWLGATNAVDKGQGDALVAGAQVIEGKVRATITWSGQERAWLRALVDSRGAVHLTAPSVQRMSGLAQQVGVAIAGLIGLATYINGQPWPAAIMAALATVAAIVSGAALSFPSIHVLQSVIRAQRRGIVYQHPDSWEECSRVTSAVFLARGTLLLGQPEVAELVALPGIPIHRLLALAAGAAMIAQDANGKAVVRHANERGVEIDMVRNPHAIPGMGVTAIASDGQPLSVGSRALMLQEHISVASVESKLTELEGLGRVIMLVAVGDRLAGFVALQDGLRGGARAAVQDLLDHNIEPILMSEDERETCEAMARSLDIDHLRPEIRPGEYAAEIQRLSEAGAVVGVIASDQRTEDEALHAADVAVVLEGAGTGHLSHSVVLASDNIKDAVQALVLARQARTSSITAAAIIVTPSVLTALAVGFVVLPPSALPISMLLGSVGAYLHFRAITAPDSHESGT